MMLRPLLIFEKSSRRRWPRPSSPSELLSLPISPVWRRLVTSRGNARRHASSAPASRIFSRLSLTLFPSVFVQQDERWRSGGGQGGACARRRKSD